MKKLTKKVRIQLINPETGWKGDSDEIKHEDYKSWIKKQVPKFPQATKVKLGDLVTIPINRAIK